MSKPKTFQTEVAIDLGVAWIAEHIPAMLEIIGGGPAGPGGVKTLTTIAKAATPEQRAKMLNGLTIIANFAEKGKTIIAEASR